MNTNLAIALIGFSAFERSTLDAFFRLAGRRVPSYVRTEHARDAQILLIDADNAQAMSDPACVPGRCVYVGAQGVEGELARVARPINMMTLLRTLDGCAARLAPVAPGPGPAAAPASSKAPSLPSPSPSPLPLPLPLQSQAPGAPKVVTMPERRACGSEHRVQLGAHGVADQRARPSHDDAAVKDHILVVDDSDVALRFMAKTLGHFGFEVHLAQSGEEALTRVAERHFAFIFMDVTMPGIDGYLTCKLIKKRPYEKGRSAPIVVMLTSRGGLVDKMRGTLSGCDAYLTKPLQREALMKVIGERIPEDARAPEPAREAHGAV